MMIAIVFAVAVFLCPNIHLYGDAIVTTKAMSATTVAEVFIENDRVRMELEIGAGDIGAFRNLLPPKIYERFQFNESMPPGERLGKFFDNGMVLFADGRKLRGKVVSIEARRRMVRDEITGEPLPSQPKRGDVVVYAAIEYELADKPSTFSIQPTMSDEGNRNNSNIGFITYHRGLPVMEFRYLAKKETLDLDWNDPWYSKYRNTNLHRQFDAPLSVFLYVENFEVRVEVVGRPADFQRFVDLGLEGEIIPVSQQAEINRKVASFLQNQFELSIDGLVADPTLDRIHFLDRTLKTTGVVFPDRDLDVSAALLGAIYVLPTQSLPGNVKVNWKLFDNRYAKIPTIATDEAGGLPMTLTEEDPILEWKEFSDQSDDTWDADGSRTSPTNKTLAALGFANLYHCRLACG